MPKIVLTNNLRTQFARLQNTDSCSLSGFHYLYMAPRQFPFRLPATVFKKANSIKKAA